ncbi:MULTISPECIES: bifunctional diguanylate cyclase/phosphodiesterase [unclassified Acidovorax]|uniref:bifunctional diguanylate cyclase/phosphodiesterase n=1 Tax=unclassified Acidovorax TaxID=2684926 RepID=UPI001E57B1B1|nr:MULTISPECIES: EAL domain-containing protein [unclassified Acidovorax]
MPIHPSHQPAAHQSTRTVGVLFLLLVLMMALPGMQGMQGVVHYLPLHMALETLAIVVAGLTFGVVWSARREQLPRNALLLACAFLGVALLDFSHMLSYSGMPDFITPSSPDKGIYFWLAARLLSALALLAVAWLPWGTSASQPYARSLVTLVLLLVAALHGVFLLAPHLVPATFVPGQGLTAFKIAFEYALMALYMAAAALLLWHMRRPRSFNASGLFSAACIMALGEFFFTRYSGVTDTYNLMGHIYKVLAYTCLYRAVFAEIVQQPYTLLRASQRQLQATLDALPDPLLEIDDEGRYVDVRTGHAGSLAAPVSELVGKTMHEVLPVESARTTMAALDEARQQGFSRGRVVALDVPDGKRWFELSVARKAPQAGQGQHFVVISRDITQRLENDEAMRKLSQAVSQSPLSIVITDRQGRIEFVNDAFTRSSEYSAAQVLGKNPRMLRSGKTPKATYRTMWAQLTQGKPWQGELSNRSQSGREFTESVLIYPVRNAEGVVTNYLAHKEDITERKLAAERIQQLSHYDQLTGLPNRTLLGQHFQYATSHSTALAVLWIDLDRFKDVNDSLGRSAGDLLLLEISHRLRSCLPDSATLSRHSGDDFVALLPQTCQDEAAKFCTRLLDVLAQPVQVAGQEIFVTASIGIAISPDDGRALDALLKNAETAMYRVKDDGRNSYRFFTPEMQAHSSRALALGNALKQALPRGELHLVYQPQVSLHDGHIIGAEALLRWTHPQWGVVSPAEFIPLAEANGLIVPIGEWVLHTALRQLRAWLDGGLPMMTVAVNLSAVQFGQAGLTDMVSQLLQQTGVPPESLELELTEAVAMKNPEIAAQKMQELSQLGIRLSIDDFGTGYSSLSYLKRFHINQLKIDQSFVRDIGTDTDDQAIATAIVQMAHSLGMTTIAEGVETAEQLDFLRARGCDQVQGYHYSRPLLPEHLEAFVRANLLARTLTPAPAAQADVPAQTLEAAI